MKMVQLEGFQNFESKTLINTYGLE